MRQAEPGNHQPAGVDGEQPVECPLPEGHPVGAKADRGDQSGDEPPTGSVVPIESRVDGEQDGEGYFEASGVVLQGNTLSTFAR